MSTEHLGPTKRELRVLVFAFTVVSTVAAIAIAQPVVPEAQAPGQPGVVTGILRTNTGLPLEEVRIAVTPADQSIPFNASLLLSPPAFSRQRRPLKIELALGESVRVPEANLTVSFKEVIEDSRCPEGVNCIQAGDAAITITLKRPNDPPASYTLHTDLDLKQEAELAGLKVQLVSLVPRPVAGLSAKQDAYRVTLLLGRK